MKTTIEKDLVIKELQKELNLLQDVLKGYIALDKLNDHKINYYAIGLADYSDASLNQLIDGKPEIKRMINRYSYYVQLKARELEALGVDPFPISTDDYIRLENDLMKQISTLKRTRRAQIFTWFRNLLKRKAAQ